MKYGKKYTIDMESSPLYIIAALALIVTPGPDVIYVLSRGIADGRVGGLVLMVLGVRLLVSQRNCKAIPKVYQHLLIGR